ncbi:stage III sporulation protein AA [Bacillus sp. FJAT-44742]|uniref:stage III sporulation protein AA n=1 Tax=Bacillus sp. FJAT-44742 TaxID=2014005 RepID=UPI000C24F758|nr:stage III sporulation protein AA [Bacillus sp. FJAT-44742]
MPVFSILPQHLQSIVQSFLDTKNDLEEIRLRVGMPVEMLFRAGPLFLTKQTGEAVEFTREDARYVLNQLSHYSIYAFEEELRQGFITLEGGHRVGVGGKVLVENGKVRTITGVSFFNVRIASAKQGVARPYVKHLYDRRWLTTLIIGPPQAGKTTFLRDLARIASSGDPEENIPSSKVGIIDERSEIAACRSGIPRHEVGVRTDVLDSCPKAEGMMMMIRSMSPEVLVVDEIGRKEDAEAIFEAIHAGVTVFATAHGRSKEEVLKRPMITQLVSEGIFECILEISSEGTGGRKGKVSYLTDQFRVKER